MNNPSSRGLDNRAIDTIEQVIDDSGGNPSEAIYAKIEEMKKAEQEKKGEGESKEEAKEEAKPKIKAKEEAKEEAKEGDEGESKEEAKEEAKQDALSRSYEDLVRRDRDLQQRRDALKSQEEKIKAYEEIQSLAQRDPMAVIRKLQMDPYSIGEHLLGEPAKKPEETQENQAYKKILEKIERLEQQQQQISHERMRHDEYNKIRGAIESSEKHEFLKMALQDGTQALDDVLQEAIRVHQDTGRAPRYTELLDSVEQRYEAQIFALLERFTSAKKVKGKLGEILKSKTSQKTPPDEDHPTGTGKKAKTATLSNDLEGATTTSKVLAKEHEKRQAILEKFASTRVLKDN